MKRKLLIILLSVCISYSYAQPNGLLDEFADFSSSFNYEFTTSDGIRLSTDLYLPITSDSMMIDLPFGDSSYKIEIIKNGTQLLIYDSINGHINPNPYQLPMVFTRTPYNKSSKDALAIIMNMLGYAYTLQDMRGRYSSEGVYYPMYSDSWKKNNYHPNISYSLDFTEINDAHNSIYHQDGYESILFLQDSLFWDFDLDNDGVAETTDKAYNGYLAMFGASAMGNSQYQAAAAYKKPAIGNDLKAMVPIVSTLEYFEGVVQQNGVFRQALINNWLRGQLEDVAIINPDDDDMQNDMHSTFDYGNLAPQEIFDLAIDQFSTIPDENGYTAMYPNYAQRCDMDASFAPINADGESDIAGNYNRYSNMEVPSYHLTGWWDIFIDGQIETYHQIMQNTSEENQKMQKMVIGPWSHGTIGMDSVGDLRFPESVFDINILYGDISDNTDNIRVDKIVESEVLSWLRHLLNYEENNFLAEPKVLIPENNSWQEYGPYQLRIPADHYYVRFSNFINYITGHEDLLSIPVELQTQDTLLAFTIDIPADTSIQTPDSEPINDPATPIINFEQVKNIRFYIPGPVNDGITENNKKGNYWYETDDFPLQNGIEWKSFYLHANGDINNEMSLQTESELVYIHHPDDPVWTIGGGNLTLRTPIINKTNAGPINLADSIYAPLTMNRADVLKFETTKIEDSLCIIGYPKAKIYISSTVEGSSFTDTDFFVRILDVYPDGREFFVVEGAVNARAREYAASIVEGEVDNSVAYSNIESGEIYELYFQLLPIAYTFGHEHKMKVLISSSNYPRYQCNANIPIETGDFFRRDVGDEQTYIFQGQEMSARIATQKVYFSNNQASQLILPLFNGYGSGTTEFSKNKEPEMIVHPNPTHSYININFQERANYKINIYTIEGHCVKSKYIKNDLFTKINMQGLSAGVYFIEAIDSHNPKIVSKVVYQP